MCLLVNAQVFSVLAQRAAWLYSPPRSGFGYISRKARWDPRLAQALRGVVNRYPHWRYRLAGSLLQGRGWSVNLKRIHRLWHLTDATETEGAKKVPHWLHLTANSYDQKRGLQLGFRARYLWARGTVTVLDGQRESDAFLLGGRS